MKTCNTCHLAKAETEFHKGTRYKGGIRPRCKKCHQTACKDYESRNPHIRKKCEKNYAARHPDKIYSKRLKHLGVNYELYMQMFAEQQGTCKICKKPQHGKKLAVDHCHRTGKIRGLLCEKCNQGLGMFKDNEQLLIEAIRYLEKNSLTECTRN